MKQISLVENQLYIYVDIVPGAGSNVFWNGSFWDVDRKPEKTFYLLACTKRQAYHLGKFKVLGFCGFYHRYDLNDKITLSLDPLLEEDVFRPIDQTELSMELLIKDWTHIEDVLSYA